MESRSFFTWLTYSLPGWQGWIGAAQRSMLDALLSFSRPGRFPRWSLWCWQTGGSETDYIYLPEIKMSRKRKPILNGNESSSKYPFSGTKMLVFRKGTFRYFSELPQMVKKVNGIIPTSTGARRISGPSTVVWLCGCIGYTSNLHWLLVMAFQAASSKGWRNFSWKPCAETWDSLKKKCGVKQWPYILELSRNPGCWLRRHQDDIVNIFGKSGNPKPTNKTFICDVIGRHSGAYPGRFPTETFSKEFPVECLRPRILGPNFFHRFFFSKKGVNAWAWTTRRRLGLVWFRWIFSGFQAVRSGEIFQGWSHLRHAFFWGANLRQLGRDISLLAPINQCFQSDIHCNFSQVYLRALENSHEKLREM